MIFHLIHILAMKISLVNRVVNMRGFHWTYLIDILLKLLRTYMQRSRTVWDDLFWAIGWIRTNMNIQHIKSVFLNISFTFNLYKIKYYNCCPILCRLHCERSESLKKRLKIQIRVIKKLNVGIKCILRAFDNCLWIVRIQIQDLWGRFVKK